MTAHEIYAPGLEGIVAGETGVTDTERGLHYRGFAVDDLAASSSFVETAYILLEGELPSLEQLADFRAILGELARVDPAILDFVGNIPLHVPAVDVLRTAVSALGNFDAQPDESHADANLDSARRIIAQFPVLIAARHRALQGLPVLESDPERSFPNNFLYLLTGADPPPLHERALEVAMILYADYAFETSTFAARTIASADSDLYSGIVAALSAFKGRRDGGDVAAVLETLEEIEEAAGPSEWVAAALANDRPLPGFRPGDARDADVRAQILHSFCTHLAVETDNAPRESLAASVEEAAWDAGRLRPTLAWPAARLYDYLGLDREIAVPVSAAARSVGWAAHFIEQARHDGLIRPRSRYTGPTLQEYVPPADRS